MTPTLEDRPIAWLHTIREPSAVEPSRMLSFSEDNPWSHWMDDHKEQCEYTRTPLYRLAEEK